MDPIPLSWKRKRISNQTPETESDRYQKGWGREQWTANVLGESDTRRMAYSRQNQRHVQITTEKREAHLEGFN